MNVICKCQFCSSSFPGRTSRSSICPTCKLGRHCKCGCGEKVKTSKALYLFQHSPRKSGPNKNKKKKQFEFTCQYCNIVALGADVKVKTCTECIKPKPCICGCGKLARTPGRLYAVGCHHRGKTYKEIYGTDTPGCGFQLGNNYNLLRTSPRHDSRLRNPNSRGDMFRSKLEVEFSEILLESHIDFEYEVPYKLLGGGNKIVDFVVGDILIEVSGYAYEAWQVSFQEKISRLRKSTDKPILVVTYDIHAKAIYDVVCAENITTATISEKNRIIKNIKFYQRIYDINRKMNNAKI